MKQNSNQNNLNFKNPDIIVQSTLQKNTAAKKMILYQSKLYFYKTYPSIEQAYYEITTYKLAEKLNINTATYHLTSFNNEIGAISETFNPQNIPTISLYEILENYKKKKNLPYTINSLNNLENIEQAIFFYTQDEELTMQIMEEMKKTIQLQFIVGDLDRRPKNILFFQIPKLHLTPNFDYNGSFSIDLKNDFTMPYALGTSFNGTQFYDPIQTISEFLKNNNQNLINNSILTIKYLPIIFYEIEKEYNQKIPNNIKQQITKIIQNNINVIQELSYTINQKGPSR